MRNIRRANRVTMASGFTINLDDLDFVVVRTWLGNRFSIASAPYAGDCFDTEFLKELIRDICEETGGSYEVTLNTDDDGDLKVSFLFDDECVLYFTLDVGIKPLNTLAHLLNGTI